MSLICKGKFLGESYCYECTSKDECFKISNLLLGNCNCEYKEKCSYHRQNYQKSIRDRLNLDKHDCTFYIMYNKKYILERERKIKNEI